MNPTAVSGRDTVSNSEIRFMLDGGCELVARGSDGVALSAGSHLSFIESSVAKLADSPIPIASMTMAAADSTGAPARRRNRHTVTPILTACSTTWAIAGGVAY